MSLNNVIIFAELFQIIFRYILEIFVKILKILGNFFKYTF